MFGICLGHQIFGLALGGTTYKLPFGHRGLNHPCGENNKIEITSQNHGFAIDPNSLSKDIVRITHYNLNDNTVAGLEVNNKPIFSVQYHPEAGPGPHDSDYLFKKFVSLMLERCWHIVFFWFDNYIWYINFLEELDHRRFPEANSFFKRKPRG